MAMWDTKTGDFEAAELFPEVILALTETFYREMLKFFTILS